ncbi:T6SS immunity protein Tdi1 domain-containing protein [Agromyces sp. MMS24-JH15]|uniref:T6SS immunity protein Tdi1 domain-containing protein n=1 Tax=Agromyces sp. MMS24-JH15 TaxID=3243765 RepID=UPI003748185A
MTSFRSFDPVAPISEETIARFAGQVPTGVADAWRRYGAGQVGADGFFRFVDPARAAQALDGVLGLPEGSTVLFTTALGDLVVHVNGIFLVVKSRLGATDVIEGAGFDDLVASIERPADLESVWEWQPYPAARDRDGVPGFEECFGFVPLLVLGGPGTADHLHRGGLWEHLALIGQLAGSPQVRRTLQLGGAGTATDASGAAGDASAGGAGGSRDRLVQIGTELFAGLTQNPTLNVIDLPDGLGVCLVHAARGGGKIYVAPDESVLFVGSAVDFDAGLGAFRDGVRTPREKFQLNGGAR